MNPRMKRSLLTLACPLAFLGDASAAITGGALTGGTALTSGGVFVKLVTPLPNPFGPPDSVGNDNFQSPNLFAFDEVQQLVLTAPLVLDVGASPLPTGTIVSSHYVFFDPGPSLTVIGTIDFDGDVLGIITSTGNLAASDFLATPGVNYLDPAGRGLEEGDSVSISGPRQVLVDLSASSPGDYVRVITAVPAAAPVFASAVSRKVHGGAGTFDLPLSAATTDPTTEPRQGPAQTIVFTFDKAITGAIVAITEGVATAGAPGFSGNDVVVNLTGVSNQQYVTVSLTDVASSDGGAGGSGTVRIGFLLGDVNLNRVVTVADLGLTNTQLAQVVSGANFLKDVNASGTLSLADKGIANANLTRALPAP
jgi:hypothetical protein